MCEVMRWLVADCPVAVSAKQLVQSQPKIKQQVHFVVVVFWIVATSGKAETLPTFRRKFLLLHSG
jgi:hypothetical protein